MFWLFPLLPFVLSNPGVLGAPALSRRASFTQANGEQALALTQQFSSLTPASACTTEGQNACVQGSFATCVAGKFVLEPCAAGLTCQVLPLVNSPGTSITCDTAADASARIANTGATKRGIPVDSPRHARRAAFTAQNGKDAVALNAKFASLTPNSPCTSGEEACVNKQFAQCVNGQFALSPCGGGLECTVLPLVNSAGTSITCDTPADAATRVSNTGAGKRALKARTPTPPPACEAKTKRSSLPEIAKRIAQADLPAVAQSWNSLCQVSGGNLAGDPCSGLGGIGGINALLANADPCAQQDNADAMVDFAKSAGITNKSALIANAQAFAVHPRNALNINGITPSTPFCQRAPRNAELNGLSHKQLAGVDAGLFGGPAFDIVAFGDPASCPFGKKPDVSTCTCN